MKLIIYSASSVWKLKLCAVSAWQQHCMLLLHWCSRGICRSEIINIYMCRQKYSICFLNWLLHGNSGQITCLGRTIQKGVVAGGISPFSMLPIREVRFMQQQKAGPTFKAVAHTEGSLLLSLWSPAVTIFLLKEPFPWSCTVEIWCGSILAGLYDAQALMKSLGLAFHGLIFAIVCADHQTTESWSDLLVTDRKVLMTSL